MKRKKKIKLDFEQYIIIGNDAYLKRSSKCQRQQQKELVTDQ